MSYCFSTNLTTTNFEEAIVSLTESLKAEGFGVITTIDMRSTFKKKLDVDFRNYTILGACHPNSAYKAVSSEPNIGVFLPCNVIVQQHENSTIEVSAVDPAASMGSVQNSELEEVATEIRAKLQHFISKVGKA